MVQVQPLVLDVGHSVRHHPLGRQGGEPLPGGLQPRRLASRHPLPCAPEPPQQLHLVRHGDLRRVGGGGRSGIGHKIGNGHVRFMAHGGDDGRLAIVNGPGHPLVVEGPQIFHGPAAPSGNNDVADLPAVRVPDSPGDLRRSFGALDPHRQQNHLGNGIAAAQDADHIVDGGTGRGGHHSDTLGIPGQRLFVSGIKKSLGVKLGLELLEGHCQVSRSLRGQGVAVELVSTVPGEHRDPAPGDDLHTVFRPEPQAGCLSPEHDAPQGAVSVLQCKIMMP